MRIYHPQQVSIGNNVYIGKNCAITSFGEKEKVIIIDDNCRIGQDNHLTAKSFIYIGRGVQTGKSVLISDNSHGDPSVIMDRSMPPYDRPLYSKGGIKIEDNCWIGENAKILGGCIIGEGSIIGANSVVTHNVPKYSIAVGCPAKILLRG